MTTAEKTLEFHQRPGFFLTGALVLLVMGIVSTLISAFTLTADSGWQKWVVVCAFGFGAALFFVTGLQNLRRFFWGTAVVMRLDSDGFWHRVSTFDKVLSWLSVEKVSLEGGKAGGLNVKVNSDVFGTLFESAWRRRIYQFNWMTIRPVLALHVGGLSQNRHDIYEAFKDYAAANGSHDIKERVD